MEHVRTSLSSQIPHMDMKAICGCGPECHQTTDCKGFLKSNVVSVQGASRNLRVPRPPYHGVFEQTVLPHITLLGEVRDGI